jgi:protein phosphatase
MAVEAVAENLARAPHRDAAALLDAVEEANQCVLAEATRDPLLEGMGTTLVAALETEENDIAIASVGDSRAWLLEGDCLRSITEDQTWIQEVGRTLGLDDNGLKTHPMRHVLTMAVGVGPELRVRYYAVVLKPEAIMMLSSDGLHGVVREEEMKRILKVPHSSIQDKCRGLIAAAHDAGSPDNITVLLLRPSS